MAAAWNGLTGGSGDSTGYRVGTRTHIGLVREQNEDFLGVSRTANGLLIIVCDGMGGHRGGQLASRLALEAVQRHVEQGTGSAEMLLREAATHANDAIVEEARNNPELQGMGTTLVAALLRGPKATIANIGDSRAYLCRGETMQRITRDHSVVGDMVASGEITEEEAAFHPRRNIITRAVGTRSGVEPDIFQLDLVRDDVILLCSDGLHGMIADTSIRTVLTLIPDPARACDELVERALSAGGKDNVSVIVARYGEGGDIPEPATDPAALAEVPGKRGPRGLGLIVGVGLGALLFMCLLVALWFYALAPDLDRDATRRDSLRTAPDSAVSPGFRYDSAGTRDTVFTPPPPRDSVHAGDTIG